jgi:hypothetical protein
MQRGINTHPNPPNHLQAQYTHPTHYPYGQASWNGGGVYSIPVTSEPAGTGTTAAASAGRSPRRSTAAAAAAATPSASAVVVAEQQARAPPSSCRAPRAEAGRGGGGSGSGSSPSAPSLEALRFHQTLAADEERALLQRLKAAFCKQSSLDISTMTQQGGSTQPAPGVELLENELLAAVQIFRRNVHGWCPNCGPKADGSFTPARCAGCQIARKRAPKRPLPERSEGPSERYGKKVYKRKQCEDCGQKQATCGTVAEGKKRWCGACGRAHSAVDLVNKKCEVCHTRSRTYGVVAEGRLRWCAPCGKARGGSTLDKLCEVRGRRRRRRRRRAAAAAAAAAAGRTRGRLR